MTMLGYILITTLISLQHSEMMIKDNEALSVIKEAIGTAIAPTITSLTERQDIIETRTTEQLEHLKSLLDSLQNAIREQQANQSSPSWLRCQMCEETFKDLASLDNHIRANHPLLSCV